MVRYGSMYRQRKSSSPWPAAPARRVRSSPVPQVVGLDQGQAGVEDSAALEVQHQEPVRGRGGKHHRGEDGGPPVAEAPGGGSEGTRHAPVHGDDAAVDAAAEDRAVERVGGEDAQVEAGGQRGLRAGGRVEEPGAVEARPEELLARGGEGLDGGAGGGGDRGDGGEVRGDRDEGRE